MPQCEARLTGGKSAVDGVWTMAFEPDGGTKNSLFFLPKRCERVTEGRLCEPCVARAAATAAVVEKRAGKYIANQQTLFHGFVGEMPPLWSHVYMSQWYVEYVAAHGKRLSAETEARAAEAFKACPGPALTCSEESKKMPRAKAKAKPTEKPTEKPTIEPVAQEPVKEMPAEKPAKPRAKKLTTPKVIEVLQEAAPATPIPEPPPPPAPKPKPRAPKKVGAKGVADPVAAQAPIGLVAASAPTDVRVVEIKVRRATVDGRQVYLSQQKDKVYDMKFNYLGRYNSREEKIVAGYPDSDLE